jgi:hypothetical protein
MIYIVLAYNKGLAIRVNELGSGQLDWPDYINMYNTNPTRLLIGLEHLTRTWPDCKLGYPTRTQLRRYFLWRRRSFVQWRIVFVWRRRWSWSRIWVHLRLDDPTETHVKMTTKPRSKLTAAAKPRSKPNFARNRVFASGRFWKPLFSRNRTQKKANLREKREPRENVREIDRKDRIDGLCENRDLLALSLTTFTERERERGSALLCVWEERGGGWRLTGAFTPSSGATYWKEKKT